MAETEVEVNITLQLLKHEAKCSFLKLSYMCLVLFVYY
jgi:hypothetical protein